MAVSKISKPDQLKVVTIHAITESIPAGAGTQVSIPFTMPDGCNTVLAVTAICVTGANLTPIWIENYSNTYVVIRVYNARSSSIALDIYAKILCN